MSTEGGPNVVEEGLVLALDAGNTKSYPGSGTTWNDLSGNTFNGSLFNSPTFNSDNAGSIVFDGSNDYVIADLPSINSAHTVMLWIYANNGLPTITGSSTGRVTPLKGNGHWNPGIWLGNNKIRGHAATKYSDYTGISWSAAAWHLIGQVYNGTSLDLIVDGEVVTPTLTANYSPGVPSQVLIGIENIGTSTTAFDGKISNVQLFDRALTASEVLQNYNATKGRFGL